MPPTDSSSQQVNQRKHGQLLFEGFEDVELFTGRHQPASRSIPRVAIQRRGNFSLNSAAFKALGEPAAVVFGYSSTTGLVVIKAAPPEVAYGSPVRKQAGAESYLVAAIAFMKSYKLSTDDAVLVFDSVPVRNGALVLELDKARKVFSQRRPARQTGGSEPGK